MPEDNTKSDLLQKYVVRMWTVLMSLKIGPNGRIFLKRVFKRLDTSKEREVFGWLSDSQDVKVRVFHGQTGTISPMYVHVLHFLHRRIKT
jgi:hypothetical protein